MNTPKYLDILMLYHSFSSPNTDQLPSQLSLGINLCQIRHIFGCVLTLVEPVVQGSFLLGVVSLSPQYTRCPIVHFAEKPCDSVVLVSLPPPHQPDKIY